MTTLTPGAVSILHGKDLNHPLRNNCLVQVINIKSVASPSGATRYRVIISDGVCYMQAMLATIQTPLIEEEELKKLSVVRITESVCNEADNRRRVLIILRLEVVSNDVSSRFGEPVSIDTMLTAGQQPPQPLQQVNQYQQHPQHYVQQSQQSIQLQQSLSRCQPQLQPQTSYQSQQDLQQYVTERNTSNSVQTSGYAHLYQSILPIKGLNPYQNKWTIKARVTQKSEIKTWQNERSEGKLFSVNLFDQSGEIKATAFKNQVDRLYPLLQEDQMYLISHARVVVAKKLFTNLDSEYELTFEQMTEIEKVRDDPSLPAMNYNFVKIADMEKKEKSDNVDVIGIIREDSGIQEIIFKSTGEPVKKRELDIVDETQKQIRVTLWKRIAETFNADGHPIVALKGVKVSEFNGRSLSLTTAGTIKRNPDIPETRKLQQWYNTHGQNVVYSTFASSVFSHEPKVFLKITIQEAKDMKLGEGGKIDYFTTRATITFIKHDDYAYPGCPGCRKKMVQEEGRWICARCHQTHDSPDYNYILTLAVEDATSQLYLGAFDQTASPIMGKSAGELTALQQSDEGAFQQVFDVAKYKTYNFKIKSQQTFFNDTPRIKYQAMSATLIDFVEESEKLIAAIDGLTV